MVRWGARTWWVNTSITAVWSASASCTAQPVVL